MPFRAVQRPPDLERVARVLAAGSGRSVGGEDADPAPRSAEEAGGWVPRAPGAGPAGGPVGSAVRRLTQRATEDDEVARLDADLRRARRPAVLTVPDELRTGRRGVSSAAVVSLLALVVAVGCVFVLRVLWAERTASGPDVAPGPSRSVQLVGGSAAAATVPGTGGGTGGGTGA